MGIDLGKLSVVFWLLLMVRSRMMCAWSFDLAIRTARLLIGKHETRNARSVGLESYCQNIEHQIDVVGVNARNPLSGRYYRRRDLSHVDMQQRIFMKGILVMGVTIALAELDATFDAAQPLKILFQFATIVEPKFSL